MGQGHLGLPVELLLERIAEHQFCSVPSEVIRVGLHNSQVSLSRFVQSQYVRDLRACLAEFLVAGRDISLDILSEAVPVDLRIVFGLEPVFGAELFRSAIPQVLQPLQVG